MAVAAVAVSACDAPTDDEPQSSYGTGRVAIGVGVESNIALSVKSSGYQIASELLPAYEDYSLRVTGTYTDSDGVQQQYDQSFATLDEYNSAEQDLYGDYHPIYLMAGEYYAEIIDNRDPSEESATNAHFAGEGSFTVEARGYDGSTNISLTLQNSIVRVSTTEEFRRYFVGGAEMTLSTTSGSQIVYTYDSTEESEEQILFLANGTELWIEGYATKQATTEDASTATTITFNKSMIGTTTKGKMNSVVIDAEGIGNAMIDIILNGEIVLSSDEDVELNNPTI